MKSESNILDILFNNKYLLYDVTIDCIYCYNIYSNQYMWDFDLHDKEFLISSSNVLQYITDNYLNCYSEICEQIAQILKQYFDLKPIRVISDFY